MFYVFRDIAQLQRLPDLLVQLPRKKKKKRAGKATQQQSGKKAILKQVASRGSAALHLVAGHALLGQLVEVSPHHVPQVVYSLLCLCFKRLLGGGKEMCLAPTCRPCPRWERSRSRTSHACTCSFSQSSLTIPRRFTLC